MGAENGLIVVVIIDLEDTRVSRTGRRRNARGRKLSKSLVPFIDIAVRQDDLGFGVCFDELRPEVAGRHIHHSLGYWSAP